MTPLSRYDAATGLADLPDVRPFLEPIGESTSQASRLAPVTIEVEESEEAGAGAGPSIGGAASSRTPQEGLTVLPP
jgi:hypothetical protein